MFERRNLALAAFAVAAAMSSPTQAAEPPPGLVMATSGPSNPPMAAMLEIPADTPIHLGSSSKLTFLHYLRCKVVTVVGGSVTLSSADYKTDGHLESEVDGPCPRVYESQDPTNSGTGGLVMRGIHPPPHWPANLQIVLTGSRADSVESATIFGANQPPKPVMTLKLGGHRADAPPNVPGLTPEARYVLQVGLKDRPDLLTIPFVAAPGGPAGPLVVLRLD
jgi:hypothetical protein